MTGRTFDPTPAVIIDAEADATAALVAIDARVDAGEHDAIFARWEFGRRLLAERERNGGKQLPNGRLAEVCARIKKSQAEVRNRMQFAATYSTREEVATAVATLGSWTAIRDRFGERGQAQKSTDADHAADLADLRAHEARIQAAIEAAGFSTAAEFCDHFLDHDEPEDSPQPKNVVMDRRRAALADVPWTGPIHPACEAFPMVTWGELHHWADDMRRNGLLFPITVTPDGTLLDGKLRLIACKLAGIEPRFEVYERDDHVAFILSMNAYRKSLTEGQRAFAAVYIEEHQAAGDGGAA